MSEERLPKEIPIARYSPDKHLAHILVKAKDVTGAMADISSRLASEGVDVRQSAAFAVSGENHFAYNAFVWLTKKEHELADVVRKLEASPYVLRVWSEDGVEGSVVDTLAFPLQFAGERMVLLSTKGVKDMFDAITKVFGSGGSVILKEQGVSYGRGWAADLSKALTKPYMVRNFRHGLKLLMATGWGIPTVLEANETLTRVVIRMDDCFECRERKATGPSGYFMTGFLAGVFSFLSGKELHGTESVCRADGQDHCEVVVS